MPSFNGLPNVTSPDTLVSDREVILDLGWLIGWVGFSTAGILPVSRALVLGVSLYVTKRQRAWLIYLALV